MADRLFYKIMEDFESSPIVNKNKKEDVIIEGNESPGDDVCMCVCVCVRARVCDVDFKPRYSLWPKMEYYARVRYKQISPRTMSYLRIETYSCTSFGGIDI